MKRLLDRNGPTSEPRIGPRSIRSWVALSLGVAVLTAGALILRDGSSAGLRARPNPASPPPGSTSPANDTPWMRAELAQLRSQVMLLQTQVRESAVSAGGRASRSDGVGPAPPDPRRKPQQAEETQQERREQMADMEAAFRREANNPRWAANMTGAIQRALDADNVGLTARVIECRSQTCRLEIADDNTGRFMKSYPHFAVQLGATLPNVTADRIEDPNGGATLVLYLTR